MKSSTVPMASRVNVMIRVALRIDLTLVSPSTAKTSFTVILWLRVSLSAIARKNIVEKIMTPSPPSCIRIMITISPNVEKVVDVFTTVSPVTHTADVAVKTASISFKEPPSELIGRASKTAPMAMAVTNHRAIRVAGVILKMIGMGKLYGTGI
jgi:hypothetical protein